MINQLRDRKTATMFLIIVALVATNLATLWRLRSQETPLVASNSANTSSPANAGSAPQAYLPIDFQCQPALDADGSITLHGTMANPNSQDLPNAKFSLYDVKNATVESTNLEPNHKDGGLMEWNLGVLPAMRQFNVFIRLKPSGTGYVTATASGKSDVSPMYMAPISLPSATEGR